MGSIFALFPPRNVAVTRRRRVGHADASGRVMVHNGVDIVDVYELLWFNMVRLRTDAPIHIDVSSERSHEKLN